MQMSSIVYCANSGAPDKKKENRPNGTEISLSLSLATITALSDWDIQYSLYMTSDTEAYPWFEKWGTTFMASAKREPILRVWGFAPSGVQVQGPWSGGQRVSAPEADEISAIQTLILSLKTISNLVK